MRPRWLVWIGIVYLAVMAVQFLMAKLKDPVNPSGYLLPKLEDEIYETDSESESDSDSD